MTITGGASFFTSSAILSACVSVHAVVDVAICRCPREYVVNVALRARNLYMRARERERRFGVVETRARPRCRRMAYRAVGGEAGGSMRRIIRVVVILRVTAIAVRRQGRVIVGGVA